MIKIENEQVFGWEAAFRGMRNPMNSWDTSDSEFSNSELGPQLGDNDLKLAKSLSDAGDTHSKYLRMITVYADVTAPLYWWKEADTYKVGTVANSCSTMHKITAKEFRIEDFSHDHLGMPAIRLLDRIVCELNLYRDEYNNATDAKEKKYDWWQMIQLLPSSYNQKRTLMMNYQVLKNIYHTRRNHKLDEWRAFCYWIETLPYSYLITGEPEKDKHE